MIETILMDVDGVLLNLVPPVQTYVQEHFGVGIIENDITSWDWDYALGIPVMSDEFWKHVWTSEITPYMGARYFIHTLDNLGYRVVAVSQRTTEEAIAHAKKEFPTWGFDNWVLADDFEQKLKFAYAMDAKWSLEDNPKTAALLGRKKDDLKSYLMNRPWNAKARPVTGSYKRVYDYNDFLNELHIERSKLGKSTI
jgi:FMN phosphatase YigB (HAD superfamily)